MTDHEFSRQMADVVKSHFKPKDGVDSRDVEEPLIIDGTYRVIDPGSQSQAPELSVASAEALPKREISQKEIAKAYEPLWQFVSDRVQKSLDKNPIIEPEPKTAEEIAKDLEEQERMIELSSQLKSGAANWDELSDEEREKIKTSYPDEWEKWTQKNPTDLGDSDTESSMPLSRVEDPSADSGDLDETVKTRIAVLHEQIQKGELDPESVSDEDYELLVKMYPEIYKYEDEKDAEQLDSGQNPESSSEGDGQGEKKGLFKRLFEKFKKKNLEFLQNVRNDPKHLAWVALGSGITALPVVGAAIASPENAYAIQNIYAGLTLTASKAVFYSDSLSEKVGNFFARFTRKHRLDQVNSQDGESDESFAQRLKEVEENNKADWQGRVQSMAVGACLTSVVTLTVNLIGRQSQANESQTEHSIKADGTFDDRAGGGVVGSGSDQGGLYVSPDQDAARTDPLTGGSDETLGGRNIPPQTETRDTANQAQEPIVLDHDEVRFGAEPTGDVTGSGNLTEEAAATAGNPLVDNKANAIYPKTLTVQAGDGKASVIDRALSSLGIDIRYPLPQGGDGSTRSALSNLLDKLWVNDAPSSRLFAGQTIQLPDKDIMGRLLADMQQALEVRGAHEALTPLQQALSVGSTGETLTQTQAELIKNTYGLDLSNIIH